MVSAGVLRLAALLACCASLVAAAPAAAGSTPAGDFSAPFTTGETDASAGFLFHVLYKNPNNPNAKPSAVDRFLFTLPAGSVFDGSAVPACKAADQAFQQRGKAACPPETVVGRGFLTVMTGFPGEPPFPTDATVYNAGDGLVELFTDQSTGAFLAIERVPFRGRNAFEAPNIADTPGGPPDGRSAAREVRIEFPVSRGADGRSFITTPPDCPASRQWTTRFDWTNADGNSYTNTHDQSCIPSNDFTIVDMGLDGRSTLEVALQVPGAGGVMVSDASTKRRNGKRVRKIRNGRAETDGAGKVTVRSALGSIAKRELARKGSFRISLKVTFTPTGAAGSSQTTKTTRFP